MIFLFKKSTYSNGASACVEVGIPKKSSYSQGNGNCVEVYGAVEGVALRDTKLGNNSPILTYTNAEWDAFIRGVKDGEFDL